MVAITRNGAGQSFQAQRKELQSGASPIGRGRGIRALLRTTAGTLGAICVPATMGIAVGFSQPAWAQAEASPPATTDIVVTGSRIKRPNLDSTVPIASVDAERLLHGGEQSMGDMLNQLPQLNSTRSQANSTRNIGTAGLNLLDLRGLGTDRTMVLINGRRAVSSTPGSYNVDINTIPTELLERVDLHGTQLALLETGQAGAFRMNNRSGLPAPDARGDDAVAGGFGAVASGARSTAIGSNAVASGAGSVALGHGATDGGRDNVVSVGREGAERQVTNVAAGTRPTDAVNLGQLSNAIDHGLVAATGYTDHHVNALRFDLANVRRDADAGTASAMAVAGLPQAFGDSGGMIGGAIGVYQNETAFALGVSKVFGDGRTVVKGGATYVETSRGSTFGGNVGIGYQF